MEAKKQKVVTFIFCSSDNGDSAGEITMMIPDPETQKNSQDERVETLETTGQLGQGENRSPDSESPLDLTLQLNKKRKLTELTFNDDHDHVRANKDKDSKEEGKRLRPSVISFATRNSHNVQMQMENRPDPEEHFRQALGPHIYNRIYGNVNGMRGRLHEGRCLLRAQSLSGGDASVDEHFKKSLGEKTWMEVQGY